MKNIYHKKNNYITINKNAFIIVLVSTIFILILFFTKILILIHRNKIIQKFINKDRKEKLNNSNNIFQKNKYIKCYLSPDNSKKKIIHLIMTRFSMPVLNRFKNIIYKEQYILNGIRVMKKYLIPSLENQSCKNFTWILIIGNDANITYIKSLLNLNNSFKLKILYIKDCKNYVRNITKGFDVLITTRIDYDDRIYYDAVNDVRKAINVKKPIILYGYNRGAYYYEFNGKYYDFYKNYSNKGVMSIFISLIVVLNKVNDTYTIYDLGIHVHVRKHLLENYKSYGIKAFNYEPAIFDSGEPKFVWVRQKYSGIYSTTKQWLNKLKLINFNLSHFYGY